MRNEEPALDMALLAQVDEMRSREVGPGAEADGWYAALDEVKALARVDAARHHNRALNQAALCARLVKENTALRVQVDAARSVLSRSVLGLVLPRPEASLAEVVTDSVEEILNLKEEIQDLLRELRKAEDNECEDCDSHECEECDCECEECDCCGW